MNQTLLETIASQGIWTLLSFILVMYILKNQEKLDNRQEERENKYQKVIEELTEKLNTMHNIVDELQEIKAMVNKGHFLN